jgi:hypothetical protein
MRYLLQVDDTRVPTFVTWDSPVRETAALLERLADAAGDEAIVSERDIDKIEYVIRVGWRYQRDDMIGAPCFACVLTAEDFVAEKTSWGAQYGIPADRLDPQSPGEPIQPIQFLSKGFQSFRESLMPDGERAVAVESRLAAELLDALGQLLIDRDQLLERFLAVTARADEAEARVIQLEAELESLRRSGLEGSTSVRRGWRDGIAVTVGAVLASLLTLGGSIHQDVTTENVARIQAQTQIQQTVLGSPESVDQLIARAAAAKRIADELHAECGG